MESIKEALLKARAGEPQEGRDQFKRAASPGTRKQAAFVSTLVVPPQVSLDPKHLESTRIVAHEMKDQAHLAFNILRTRVQKILKDNGWKSLAVMSPTAGCGKTVVAANLALSFARQPECKTVLIDLDLTRHGLAGALGVTSKSSIGEHLEGRADFDDCFVQIGDNLIVGLNSHSTKNPSELMHSQRLKEMLVKIEEVFRHDVLIVDLPPMMTSDDAMGFLPNADSSMLVVSAERSTVADVQECQRLLGEGPNYIGAVINKSEDKTKEYYLY